jgi:hypothetical protein
LNVCLRVPVEADGHERLEADAERRRRDLRVVAAQHARARQRPHALQAGGRGEAGAGGELLVAEPSIVL